MPRRHILTERQRATLFDLPTTEVEMLRHYILADDDIEHIHARRRAHNRLGFALQLCVFRYPGRLLNAEDVIPARVIKFIAAQLGMDAVDLDGYANREGTRREHLAELCAIYGYKMFTGRGARDLKAWLGTVAEAAFSNEDLAQRFVAECRCTQTILPGVSVIERLCADALVAAECKIEARISERLDAAIGLDAVHLACADQAGEAGPISAALVVVGKERVAAVHGGATDGVFDEVGVDVDAAIVEEQPEAVLSFQHIGHGLAEVGFARHARGLCLQPGKAARLKHLVDQHEPGPIPNQNLQPVATF